MLAALEREIPDRLPVTTHHVMPSYLNRYLKGMDDQEFFDFFSLDPLIWVVEHRFDPDKGEFFDPLQGKPGFLEAKRVCNPSWRFREETLDGPGRPTRRFTIITPEKELSMVLQSDEHTSWVTEHLIKQKSDIDILGKYMTSPGCDVEAINRVASSGKRKGLLRGHICCFDGFGQPGTWQDAACLYGIQNLIMATFEDPQWVHAFLKILMERKIHFAASLKGALYDILELGGGDASTTVISPDIFETFVAPYDEKIIETAHRAGQRIVYHTCGGMMPVLENIAAMNPDAMETFTPPGMGGDVKLSEAKKRIGDKVCMIGGFDQFHFLKGCSKEDTRREVRRCFREAGSNGGYILATSDHFFDAETELIRAYADEARKCFYNP